MRMAEANPAVPPNNPINPTVVPVTRLACARRAPVPPAGYRERSAELQTRTARLHFPMSVKLSL